MDTEEALRRVRRIAPILSDDVRTAVRSHAVLEAANDTIPRGVKNHEFAATFNAIQNALGLKLALELARIFDLSKRGPPQEQDKASVPVLAALLGRADVQLGLEREAESNWFPGVAHIGTVGTEPPGEIEAALRSLEEDSRSEDHDFCRAAIADFLAVAGRMKSPKRGPHWSVSDNSAISASPTRFLIRPPTNRRDIQTCSFCSGSRKKPRSMLRWLSKGRTEISTMLHRLIVRTLTAITPAFSKGSSARRIGAKTGASGCSRMASPRSLPAGSPVGRRPASCPCRCAPSSWSCACRAWRRRCWAHLSRGQVRGVICRQADGRRSIAARSRPPLVIFQQRHDGAAP